MIDKAYFAVIANIKEDDLDDPLIDICIKSAANKAQRYCNRVFEVKEYAQELSPRLTVFKQWPMVELLDAPPRYELGTNERGEVISLKSPYAKGCVRYKAGYGLIPDELKLAVAIIAAHYFKLIRDELLSTSSKTSRGSRSDTTEEINHEIPIEAKTILDSYSRLEVY